MAHVPGWYLRHVRLVSISAVLVVTAAMLMSGLAAAAGTASPPKRVSITGKITVLKVKTIRVHGIGNLTCRITTASPKATLRGFTLGMKAKITCKQGVLAAISKALALQPSPVAVTPSPTITVPKDPTPEPTITTPPTGGVKIAPNVTGTAKITAIGGGQIEFGSDISCQVTSSSPNVASYRVGALVSYTCSGGTLTAIGTGEGA